MQTNNFLCKMDHYLVFFTPWHAWLKTYHFKAITKLFKNFQVTPKSVDKNACEYKQKNVQIAWLSVLQTINREHVSHLQLKFCTYQGMYLNVRNLDY